MSTSSTSSSNAGSQSLQRGSYPQVTTVNTKDKTNDISSKDEWVSATSSSTEIPIYGDALSHSENDAGNNDRNSKKAIAKDGALKMSQAPTSASIYANDDAGENVQGNVDNDVGNDADNNVGNLKNSIEVKKFVSALQQTLPPATAPVEPDDAVAGAYDCREFARTIRGNWKIIAPTLTAASGVAALAVLTIGARGSIGGTQLSFGARWGTWIAGYFMTQATIIIGTTCIPSFQCR
jgi:hypothetical protein